MIDTNEIVDRALALTITIVLLIGVFYSPYVVSSFLYGGSGLDLNQWQLFFSVVALPLLTVLVGNQLKIKYLVKAGRYAFAISLLYFFVDVVLSSGSFIS